MSATSADARDTVVTVADSGQGIVERAIGLRELVGAGFDPHGGQVPAIALTAYAGAQDSAMTLAAGFHRHLTKPIEPSELVTAVAQLAAEYRPVKTRM